MLDLFFNDNSGRVLNLREVVEEMKEFINADRGRLYKIIVGTDSELLNNKHADFVTALVIHRVGNGGRYFWRRVNIGSFHTLRDRILKEVLLSLEIAKEFLIALGPVLISAPTLKGGGVDFEIHVDIGNNGETRYMIQEVVGMIRAHNFEPQIKPLSFGATKVADRHC